MKITLITDFTPTIDNYNGPSALCYHLMKELRENDNIQIITTNSNKVPATIITKSETIIGTKYYIEKKSLWMKLLTSRKTGFLFSPFLGNRYGYMSRYKVPNKIVAYVNAFDPDLIIVYPYYLIEVLKQFPTRYKIAIGPDSVTLYALRRLHDSYIYKDGDIHACIKRLKEFINIEKDLSSYCNGVALVGRNEVMMYKIVSQSSNAFFLPHPHYLYGDRTVSLKKEKIHVLISGNITEFVYSDMIGLTEVIKRDGKLLNRYDFTFLGKVWKNYADEWRKTVDTYLLEWVDNYQETLSKYDIQLFPISLGGGTKGKVLDALSYGLLTIGSYYAFENIAIQPNISCVLYHNVNQISAIFQNIILNPTYYETIAKMGHQVVSQYHNPRIPANVIVDYSNKGNTNIDEEYYYMEKQMF